jgi:hypothetical protein
MAGKVHLKQLAQAGAVDGQVAAWSAATGQWEPVTVAGGGSIKSVEVDFGSTPTRYKTFTITDASVSAASKIIVVQSGAAATGGQQDDAEMDPIVFSARAGAGQVVFAARTLDGVVVGKYVVDYQVG